MKKTVLILTSGLFAFASLPALADTWANISNSLSEIYDNTGYYNRQRHSSGLRISIDLDDDSSRHWDRRNQNHRRDANRRSNNRQFRDHSDNRRFRNNNSRRNRHGNDSYNSGYSNRQFNRPLGNIYSAVPYWPTARPSARHHQDRGYSSRHNNNGRDSNHRRSNRSVFIRDSRGNCYERSYDRHGNERRNAVNRRECR